jgi:cold shock protein
MGRSSAGTKGGQLAFTWARIANQRQAVNEGQVMTIGTVRWFNPLKGFGFIHPDDGGPNILVQRSAVESAGMSEFKEGQRIIFEIQRDERSGDTSAVSLKALVPATTPYLDRRLATKNPFDVISDFILSAMSPILRP